MKFPKGIEVIVGVVIENDEGEILLVKGPKWANKWVMPGGHVEVGEKITDAAVREGEEETGLKLTYVGTFSFGELINSNDFHRSAHFIYFDVVLMVKNGDVKLDKRELTEYQWVVPKEALKMDLVEKYDKTIQEYIKFKKEQNE